MSAKQALAPLERIVSALPQAFARLPEEVVGVVRERLKGER